MKLNREAIIPARNEASTIAQVIKDTAPYVDRVVVVDDASTDETASQATRSGATVISHQRPRGYLNSLKSGLQATTAATVIFLDADGKHDPADIPALVAPIEANTDDMVFGKPGAPVRWSEGVLCRLAALRLPIRNTGFGYRALNGDLARRMAFRGRCGCGLMALDAQKLRARLAEVTVDWRPVHNKRRRAWFHLVQLGWVIRGLAGL